jgi:hypothetical protein
MQDKKLTWKITLFLGSLGVIVSGIIAIHQKSPGYMDADYYYAGGLQLASGNGFSEPYIWNYLDDPTGIPHPSNAYWMPLASIITAAGMILTGQLTWIAGRIGFFLIAAGIPIITATLALSFSKRVDLAVYSGLLAIFSVFYAAFIPVTDTFGLYMVLGGSFFILLEKPGNSRFLGLGVISGLMHLARADGILWLFMTIVIVSINQVGRRSQTGFGKMILPYLLVLGGYLLVMGGWFIRNGYVFGSILAPGGTRMLWLTSYDQIFSFPAGSLTFNSWMENGIQEAIRIRLWALSSNLQNTLGSQASIFLLPFILVGAWISRKDGRIFISLIAWAGYLFLMSIIFPFAGARGGFFHSCAALQPLWWSLAPIGVVTLTDRIGKLRKWNIERASQIFLISTIGLSILLTGVIVVGKLYNTSGEGIKWDLEMNLYTKIDRMFIATNDQMDPIVIVSNPPGFFVATGRKSIAIPDGDEKTLMAVAKKFGGNYLVLDESSIPKGLFGLYQNPTQSPDFQFLGDVEGTHVYGIQP